MKFPYKKLAPGVVRPIVPIKIRHPRTGKEVSYEVLVDSGADENNLPKELAQIIGLDLRTGTKTKVGGVVPGQYVAGVRIPVDIVVGGWVVTSQAVFLDELGSQGHGLVGRQGFFDRFRFVKFTERKNEIEIGDLII